MPLSPPPVSRSVFRFVLPPSVGLERAQERASRLEFFLQKAVGRRAEVTVAADYESLAKDVLSAKVDAAWAPPWVCARLEAMGVPVRLRGIRHGSSSYRAALVKKRGTKVSLESLAGKRAAWVDRDSVGGYLLAMAFLKERKLDARSLFFAQDFSGSYTAALEAVVAGTHDVTSVFAPPTATSAGATLTGIEQALPGKSGEFEPIAFTADAPNDGIVVSLQVAEETAEALERSFLDLKNNASGKGILWEIFDAERFEPAPRLGYRALYRVALAAL